MNKVFWVIFFSVLFLIFAGLSLYFHFMGVPEICKSGCALAKERAPWLNGPDCLSVVEKYEDKTIPKPTAQPYLRSFVTQGQNYPFCNPVWYAFRYVRNKDGGYGPLSEWSGYNPLKPTDTPLPIFSGAKTFPCIPVKGSTDSCSAIGVKTGADSCAFNNPWISLLNKLDFDVNFSSPDGYTLNVHRQEANTDKEFDPNDEGDIVGFFTVNLKPESPYNIIANFIDAVYNPNSTKSTTCCS